MFVILMLVNLICSYNNIIFILNFICLLFIFIFILFVFNLINITLFMLLIYATLINLLFLVNGLLLISSHSYIYSMFNSYLIINNLNLDISIHNNNNSINAFYLIHLFFLIQSLQFILNYYLSCYYNFIVIIHYHNAIIYISLIHFYNLCYSSINSVILNVGLTRLGNLIFDNSLFCLLFLMFVINLINLNSIFIIIFFFLYYCHLSIIEYSLIYISILTMDSSYSLCSYQI